jgi:hypothetical protein
LTAACASTPPPDPTYAPTQSVLEVVALLRLHVEDDTYRFPPARDFTGKNVYRAVLGRLESLEQIHAERFGAGYLTDVIWFSKARALERIGEFDLAAKHYQRTQELETPLRDAAQQGRAICEQLAAARRVEIDPTAEPEQALAAFDQRSGQLDALRPQVEGTHYRHVLQEELERVDRERADYFAARSRLDPRLDAFVLQELQEVVQRHRDSKLEARHLLALADFYAELSRRYVGRYPPTALGFDPAVFDEYAFGATRTYEVVSQRDGALEKLEASRKLQAFLAFTLEVYDERLP